MVAPTAQQKRHPTCFLFVTHLFSSSYIIFLSHSLTPLLCMVQWLLLTVSLHLHHPFSSACTKGTQKFTQDIHLPTFLSLCVMVPSSGWKNPISPTIFASLQRKPTEAVNMLDNDNNNISWRNKVPPFFFSLQVLTDWRSYFRCSGSCLLQECVRTFITYGCYNNFIQFWIMFYKKK